MGPMLAAIVTTGFAGLGGALAVFGSYDDSPGGTLLGFAVVVVAMVLNGRRARVVSVPPSEAPPATR